MNYLNKAYKEFAENGMEGITIFNRKNDSVENFKHELLSLHVDKINFIILLIKKKNITYNELFEFLAEYPDEIKFCKQLFIHRENPEMNMAFLFVLNSIKPIILSLLKNHFNLSEDIEYFDSLWMSMVESWYSGLDVNNLTVKHMKDVSEETAAIIINHLINKRK